MSKKGHSRVSNTPGFVTDHIMMRLFIAQSFLYYICSKWNASIEATSLMNVQTSRTTLFSWCSLNLSFLLWFHNIHIYAGYSKNHWEFQISFSSWIPLHIIEYDPFSLFSLDESSFLHLKDYSEIYLFHRLFRQLLFLSFSTILTVSLLFHSCLDAMYAFSSFCCSWLKIGWFSENDRWIVYTFRSLF